MRDRRQLRETCRRKQRHPSPGAAQAALRSLLKRTDIVLINPEQLTVYQCRICHGWHVGHDT